MTIGELRDAESLFGEIIDILLPPKLGAWIVFSAFFLYVFEKDHYDKQLNHDLDSLDGLFAAEVQAEVVKRFECGQSVEAQAQSLEEAADIPTGLAPDIAKQVDVRRARRKPVPDNLEPETPDNPEKLRA